MKDLLFMCKIKKVNLSITVLANSCGFVKGWGNEIPINCVTVGTVFKKKKQSDCSLWLQVVL